MRTISLRKFRDSIADIGEVVEVARRDVEGNIQIIGTWTPSVTYPKGARAVAAVLADDPEVESKVTAIRQGIPEGERFSSRPFTPVPKGGKR